MAVSEATLGVKLGPMGAQSGPVPPDGYCGDSTVGP